jgi:hypothetical protein
MTEMIDVSIVSHRHKFIYTPAIGCADDLVSRAIIDNAKGANNRIDYIDNEFIQNPGYFTFTFIKHPLDRLVEFYIKNVALSNQQVQFGTDELTKRGNYLSFEEYMKHIAEIDSEDLRPHLRPLHLLIPDTIEFIGKCENFEEDWQKVCEKIGEELVGDWKRFAVSDTIYPDFFEPTVYDMVKSYYEPDLQRFGYNNEITV